MAHINWSPVDLMGLFISNRTLTSSGSGGTYHIVTRCSYQGAIRKVLGNSVK